MKINLIFFISIHIFCFVVCIPQKTTNPTHALSLALQLFHENESGIDLINFYVVNMLLFLVRFEWDEIFEEFCNSILYLSSHSSQRFLAVRLTTSNEANKNENTHRETSDGGDVTAMHYEIYFLQMSFFFLELLGGARGRGSSQVLKKFEGFIFRVFQVWKFNKNLNNFSKDLKNFRWH